MSVPSQPILIVRPKATSQTLEFYWSAPSSDGGSAITSYVLTDGTINQSLTTGFGYAKLTGLTNGQTYSFTLAASNAIGLGSSAAFRSVQPGNRPDAPTNPSYTTITNPSYQITWANPSNTGGASLLGTVLTAYPLDASGNLITTPSLLIKKSVRGNGLVTGKINLTSNYNYKVLIQAVNDPGYCPNTCFTSTITTALGGSMAFAGTTSSYLTVPNDIDFRFGTGDFTVEWFQYQTASASFPRIFAMGNYPSTTIGVSIEGGTFYLWIGGSAVFSQSVTTLNQWVHFAITREGSSLRVFRNGTQIGSTITNTTDINNTTNIFTIGNESTRSTGAAFQGQITNFRWVKGTAIYTSNFPTPTSPLTAVTNTKLLLLASSSGAVSTDSSATPKTVTNSSVTWSATNPFS